MSFLTTFKSITACSAACVLAGTALPIFGAVGTITATGAAVCSVIGGIAGLIDSVNTGEDHRRPGAR